MTRCEVFCHKIVRRILGISMKEVIDDDVRNVIARSMFEDEGPIVGT